MIANVGGADHSLCIVYRTTTRKTVIIRIMCPLQHNQSIQPVLFAQNILYILNYSISGAIKSEHVVCCFFFSGNYQIRISRLENP